MNVRTIVASIVAVIVAIIGLTVVLGSWYTVDQGERGVLLRNGAVIGMAQPGLGFKTPWIEEVVEISVRQHVITWGFEGGTAVMQAYSKDQQPADMRVTVNYRVPESEVANVYSNYGSVEALAERTVARKAPQEIKTVFGQYNAVSVIQSRAKFNQDAMAAVLKAVEGAPIIIDGVQIENIDFSDAYEASIEQRMLAEVEVQKLRQNAEREIVQAEITVTQAKAKADAVRAEATAQAEATRLRGNAEADAIKARGQALRDNPTLIQLVQAEKWDGKLPQTMVPGSAVPFINIR